MFEAASGEGGSPIEARRASPVSPLARRAIVAVLLLLAGLSFAALYRILSGTEHHSFSASAVAPASARVTAGKTYDLAVAGGIRALKRRGANVASAECEWSSSGSAIQALSVAVEAGDTKATNQVASFVARVTGDLHVDCAGWGVMFIDDADNAGGDTAGWCLVASAVLLALGAGLGVSALRSAYETAVAVPDSAGAAGDDDDVEGFVYAGSAAVHPSAVHPGGTQDDRPSLARAHDLEVRDADGGDVGP